MTASATASATDAKESNSGCRGGSKAPGGTNRDDDEAKEKDDTAADHAESVSSSVSSFLLQYHSSAAKLSEQLADACLVLFEANMANFYRNSSFGLDLAAKRSELTHPKARYLLVFDSSNSSTTKASATSETPSPAAQRSKFDAASSSSESNPAGSSAGGGGGCCSGGASSNDDDHRSSTTAPSNLAAFVHFRFCLDDDEVPGYAVLYVYEIQVGQSHAGLGIGTFLMNLLQDVAHTVGLDKVALTALKSNVTALRFYKDRLGFKLDDTDPSHGGETADYEILSKSASRAAKRAL
jgi:ribosomal protein S18 acetylase RimI-like enzyme